jgi:hypothetical protein
VIHANCGRATKPGEDHYAEVMSHSRTDAIPGSHSQVPVRRYPLYTTGRRGAMWTATDAIRLEYGGDDLPDARSSLS